VKDRTIRPSRRLLPRHFVVSSPSRSFAVRNINRSVAASDWVNHTHAVILEARYVLALRAGDAALRTYFPDRQRPRPTGRADRFAETAEHLGDPRHPDPKRSRAANASRDAGRVGDDAGRAGAGLARGAWPRPTRSAACWRSMRAAGLDREIERRVEIEDARWALAERDTASYLQRSSPAGTVWCGVPLNLMLLAGGRLADPGRHRGAQARRRRARGGQPTTRPQGARAHPPNSVAATSTYSNENLERQWATRREHQLRYDQLILNSISDLVFVLDQAPEHFADQPRGRAVDRPRPSRSSTGRFRRCAADGGSDRAAGGPMIDPIAHALRIGRDLRDEPALIKDRRGSKTPSGSRSAAARRQQSRRRVVILQVVRPPGKSP